GGGNRAASDVERDGHRLFAPAADCARRRTLDRDGVLVRAPAGRVEWRGAVRGVAEELCRVLDELRAVSDLRADLHRVGDRRVDPVRAGLARTGADDRG